MSNNSRKIRVLHYPVDATEVSKSLKHPNGVAYTSGIVFVADTGNERVAYKAIGSSVFMDPNFFSQMRSRNDMPTALEFAYLFAPTIRESLKQLTDSGFVYYTSRTLIMKYQMI